MSTYYNATYLSTESTIARSDISHLAPAPLQNRSYSYEAPEWNRESEGLQINPNGPHPFPSTKAIDSTSKHSLPWLRSIASTQKQLAVGQEGLIPADEATNHDRTRTIKRKTFIIILSICVLIVICAAVGGAVGGYYGTRSSHPPTPTVTPSLVTTSTPHPQTPSPVEQGSTGMAHLPCVTATVSPASAPQATPRDIDNPYQSPVGVHSSFDITCRRGIPGWGDKDRNAIATLGAFTTYNFTACMDRCSEVGGCMGVVYSANLTAMVEEGGKGGNCLLKNATWDPVVKRAYWLASAVRRG